LGTTDFPSASKVHEVDVVLLFTDIEDSTPKWEDSFSSMSSVLQRHDDILVGAIVQSGGSLLKHTGDGVIAHFHDAPAAVKAAIEAQRQLHQEDFSAVGGLSVRMGIHAGQAQERGGDLFGPTLNQCGRVMSVAHGGQVITTSVVAKSLTEVYGEWCASANAGLVDLGVHRFKGLSNPERLYQVTHPDLEAEFPSPTSLNAQLGNLPGALSTLVGRSDLVTHVSALLREPEIVTLTGPGGVGKTSIALHVGRSLVDLFPDGVWIVDLSHVVDAAGAGAALAQTLGIAPRLGQNIEETLKDAFGVRRALIILDNAERPRSGTLDILNRVIVRGSPIRILATSFSPIGVAGEVRVRVEPLTAPEGVDLTSLESAQHWSALQLFVERAQIAMPDFELTQENLPWAVSICERLDGLPLAIELAAARVELLTLEQISSLLSHRFQLLQSPSGPDNRHKALATTLEWSVELLSPEAKTLFVRLGVLASTFDLAAACAMGGRDEIEVVNRLSELSANSMLNAEPGTSGVDYRMLESLRLFAEEQLQQQTYVDDVRQIHAHHFAQRAAEMRTLMWGPRGLEMVNRGHRTLPDLRRAFDYFLDYDTDAALKIFTDLYALWILRDLAAEGVRWFSDALDVLGGIESASPNPALVMALDDAGTLAWMIGEESSAELYLNAALDMAARLGLETPPKALIRLGTIRMLAGDTEEGRRMCRIATELSLRADNETQLVVERTLGAVLSFCGDQEEGAAICRQAIVRSRNSDLWLTSALTNYVWSSYLSDPAAAVEAAREAVTEATRIGSSYYLGSAWSGLALASWRLGDLKIACRAWAEAIQNMLDAGAKNNVLVCLNSMSDAMFDVAPEIATTLSAGAARQHGPGADGTWLELRFGSLKKRADLLLAPDRFDAAWNTGASLSIDSLVRLARASTDEIFPLASDRSATK
jgi:predicted ATPase/class 3 adenylate cyclase